MLITGCNNEKSTDVTAPAAADSNDLKKEPEVKMAGAGGALLSVSDFAYLAIHKDSLKRFFVTRRNQGGYKAQKLVFSFTNAGTTNSKTVIHGFLTYPGNSNYLKDRGPTIPVDAGNSKSYANRLIYLSNVVLTRKQYDTLPDPGNNVYLIFEPVMSSIYPNFISYKLYWKTTLPIKKEDPEILTDDELNPSPPADPAN